MPPPRSSVSVRGDCHLAPNGLQSDPCLDWSPQRSPRRSTWDSLDRPPSCSSCCWHSASCPINQCMSQQLPNSRSAPKRQPPRNRTHSVDVSRSTQCCASSFGRLGELSFEAKRGRIQLARVRVPNILPHACESASTCPFRPVAYDMSCAFVYARSRCDLRKWPRNMKHVQVQAVRFKVAHTSTFHLNMWATSHFHLCRQLIWIDRDGCKCKALFATSATEHVDATSCAAPRKNTAMALQIWRPS